MPRIHRSPIPTALLALALALVPVVAVGCGSSDDGGDDTSRRSTTTVATTTSPTVVPAEDRLATLQFRPVLSSAPCDTQQATSTTTSTSTTAPAADEEIEVPQRDGVLCYRLGPAGADGTDLNKGRVRWVDGAWLLEAYPKALSIPDVSGLFAACYEGTEACPAGEGGHGSVAIVWDGALVSTTLVDEPDVGTRRFTLRPDFTDSQAEELSVLLPPI